MSKSTTTCANLGVVLDSISNCHISCEGVRVSEEKIEIVLTCVLSCMRYRGWGWRYPPNYSFSNSSYCSRLDYRKDLSMVYVY